MTLMQFRDMLLAAGLPVWHHYIKKQDMPYIRWAEYNQRNIRADNGSIFVINKIVLDYFTKREYDPQVETITQMLNNNHISYNGPSLVSDGETECFHYIWDCEVV